MQSLIGHKEGHGIYRWPNGNEFEGTLVDKKKRIGKGKVRGRQSFLGDLDRR